MSETITLREFRNESAAVMDRVEAGESFVVTRNGHPVAKVGPISRRRRLVPIDELRQAFSAGADPDYTQMRGELDAIFGEDRIGEGEDRAGDE
jgi:prevent-host-death family protein